MRKAPVGASNPCHDIVLAFHLPCWPRIDLGLTPYIPCVATRRKRKLDVNEANELRGKLLERRRRLEQRREQFYAKKLEGRRDIPLSARLFEAGISLIGLKQRGMDNARAVATETISYSFPRLPAAFDGFRIALCTDMHFRETPFTLEPLTACLRAVEADLCVLGGDFLFARHRPFEYIFPMVRAVVENLRCKDGCVAVLGNHDFADFIEPFSDVGLRTLMNEHICLERGEDRIWVAGVDDPSSFRTADLQLASAGIPENAFKVLLAHSPDLLREASAADFDLYLCGHTHWGQVRLPGIGAVVTNARVPRRYCAGRWEFAGMHGYTSPGVGTTDIPVRFNCPPRVSIIELRCA